MEMVLLYKAVQGGAALSNNCRGQKKNSADRILSSYDIDSKYEGHDESDDESGSRTYPVRTLIGKQRVIGKDMNYLMQPRNMLLWFEPAYMYRWGYSKVYIDILYADDIITQYDSKKKDKGESNADRRVNKTMERWYAMHPEKRPKKRVDLDDLMKND
jgi:hypothetical protein